jgi:hypothetical protein
MKKLIVAVTLIFLSFGIVSKELPVKSKNFLLKNLPTLLQNQFDSPEMQACWYQGINGNDDALSAMYVIYKSMEIVQKNADATKAFYIKNTVNGKFNGNVSEMINKRDHKKLIKIVKLMPRAVKYCESFIPKSEKK